MYFATMSSSRLTRSPARERLVRDVGDEHAVAFGQDGEADAVDGKALAALERVRIARAQTQARPRIEPLERLDDAVVMNDAGEHAGCQSNCHPEPRRRR